MTSETPAQRPAAPETETDANAMWALSTPSLWESPDDRSIPTLLAAIGQVLQQPSAALDAARERVRVVEGEREDAWASRGRAREQAHDAIARAESAEAAHEAEKAAHEEAEQHIVQLTESRDRAEAAHERLRAEVEALADDLRQRRDRLLEEFEGPRSESRAKAYGAVVSQITALLGGGEAR